MAFISYEWVAQTECCFGVGRCRRAPVLVLFFHQQLHRSKRIPRHVGRVVSCESSRYKIDAVNRIVTLTLNPDEALLLARCRPANDGSTGDCEPDAFDVAEIGLVGANGEITLAGEQAHKTFVRTKILTR